MEDVSPVRDSHGTEHRLLDNDKQVYVSDVCSNVGNVCCRLSDCTTSMSTWRVNVQLQQLVLSPSSRLKLVGNDPFNHCPDTTTPSNVVFSSVWSHMWIEQCFQYIRCLRQIRHHVGHIAAIQLILVLITSWLDNCNARLVRLPASTVVPLQRVQNAACKTVF